MILRERLPSLFSVMSPCLQYFTMYSTSYIVPALSMTWRHERTHSELFWWLRLFSEPTKVRSCCLVSFTVTPTHPPLHHATAKHKWTNAVRQSWLLNNQGRHPWRLAALPWVFRTPSCARGWPCPACREVWQRDLTALLPCPRTRCHWGIIRAEWVVSSHQLHGPCWTMRKSFPTKRLPTKGVC